MLSPTRLAILIAGIVAGTAIVVVAIVVPIVILNNPSRSATGIVSTTIRSTSTILIAPGAVLSPSTVALSNENDQYTFNQANSPFTLQLSQPILDIDNYVLFTNNNNENNNTLLNTVNTVSTNTSITAVNGFPASGSVLLSLIAQDINGLPIFTSFYLYFGSISMPVRVLFANGSVASGVRVQMNLTDYILVSQQGITNSSGIVTFENVPPTTVSLFARTTDNQIGLGGVSPTPTGITITLMPFISGTAGRKRRTTNPENQWLTVNTNGSRYLQTETASFTSEAGATQVYIEYQFVTAEVPGGYFGSQFNDYFSITLRSSTGTYRTLSQSMNSLGLGAFNYTTGETTWSNLTMPVGPQLEQIEIDLGVSNVGDDLYQSEVNVRNYGSDQCNISTCDQTCSSQCASKPICSLTCSNPPLKSCQFYTNCMEAETTCGIDGYALGYGLKYCTKFMTRVKSFSAQGQTWIYSTMNCLQKGMVSSLQNCEKNCATLKDLAFSSHAACYVNNGICNLPPSDWLRLLTVVGADLLNDAAFLQAMKTSSECISNIISRIDTAITDIQESYMKIALKILRKWFKSL